MSPDFEETRNRVWARSIESAVASTCAGTVESSTSSSGYPSTLWKVCRRTSAPRLLPPMPSRTTYRYPSLRTSLAKVASSPARSDIWSATSSHPRRLVISSGLGFQTVWSLRQMRPTTSFCWSSASFPSTSGGFCDMISPTEPVPRPEARLTSFQCSPSERRKSRRTT